MLKEIYLQMQEMRQQQLQQQQQQQQQQQLMALFTGGLTHSLHAPVAPAPAFAPSRATLREIRARANGESSSCSSSSAEDEYEYAAGEPQGRPAHAYAHARMRRSGPAAAQAAAAGARDYHAADHHEESALVHTGPRRHIKRRYAEAADTARMQAHLQQLVAHQNAQQQQQQQQLQLQLHQQVHLQALAAARIASASGAAGATLPPNLSQSLAGLPSLPHGGPPVSAATLPNPSYQELLAMYNQRQPPQQLQHEQMLHKRHKRSR
jgi:hypothetical protein